jgi:hypothetical protein
VEEDREEEGFPDPLISGLHQRRRVSPRAASDGGALEHAPPAFLHEFLQFLKHFPCNFWSFKDHFVNLKLFYVIFIYF